MNNLDGKRANLLDARREVEGEKRVKTKKGELTSLRRKGQKIGRETLIVGRYTFQAS